MALAADRDISPLEEALEYHLWNRGFRDPGQVRIALRTVVYAQVAVKRGDENWLDHQVVIEPGSSLTKSIKELIELYHLNAFIDWGGGEGLD